MTTVQVYGQFGDHYSNAGVSRGIAAGLAANGLSVTALSVTDREYLDCWSFDGLVYAHGRDQAADVGVAVGYPVGPMGLRKLLEPHRVKVGLFIAESSAIPEEWGRVANWCDLVCVPSAWVAGAYERAGVAPEKLLVVHHGIHPVFHQCPSTEPERPETGWVRLLHVAGARDFLERKGTPQLLQAMDLLAPKHPQLRLVVRTPEGPQIRELHVAMKHPECVEILTHDRALSPSEMRTMLLYGRWSAVIQPSRAEAFGLVPLEARACGLPALITDCAGHAEHVWDRTNLVHLIASSGEKEISVNGIPGGLAPSVGPWSVADAVLRFVRDPKLQAQAGCIEQYNWRNLLAPVARKIRLLVG